MFSRHHLLAVQLLAVHFQPNLRQFMDGVVNLNIVSFYTVQRVSFHDWFHPCAASWEASPSAHSDPREYYLGLLSVTEEYKVYPKGANGRRAYTVVQGPLTIKCGSVLISFMCSAISCTLVLSQAWFHSQPSKICIT